VGTLLIIWLKLTDATAQILDDSGRLQAAN